MPLNTITITIQQIVHDTQGWNSVQVGEMTRLWIQRFQITFPFDVDSFRLNVEFKVGVVALDCSSAALGSASSYFLVGMSSASRGLSFWRAPPKKYKIKESFVFPQNKTKNTVIFFRKIRQSTNTCLKRSKLPNTCCVSESICTLQTSKVSPCGQHRAWVFCLFFF